jgi:hypothetical protein
MLAPGDPTDHALAAIASILDHSEPRREAENAPPEKPLPEKSLPEKSPPLVPMEVDGYTKASPGPIAAIRFKWIVRRADNDEYFVDEMIGESSTRATSGPMPKEAAVKLVDDREADARRRFEALRSEMSGRTAGADPVRGDEA